MKEHIPFRDHHILQILCQYENSTLPLDLLIHRYFQAHKALGSKDRAYVSDTVYEAVRWKGLLDHLVKNKHAWKEKIDLMKSTVWTTAKSNPSIPIHARLSFPSYLYERLVAFYGETAAQEICLSCNEPAPTTIRVNTLKISREELWKRWKDQYELRMSEEMDTALVFEKKISLFSLPEFKAGFFEMQDAGSQCLARLVNAKPGQHVLDYCAGSGGKALAIAPFMQQQGQLYLHDIRSAALIEAKRRLRRAGVQNAQIIPAEDPKLKKIKKRMDWVLVDAPCSGTGTLRRNPDMKWKIDESMITRLVSQQRVIFERALSFLAPGGTIVYATCSLLPEENQQQMEHFTHTYDLELVGSPFHSVPRTGKMDGFFGVAFRKKV